ncbi:ABC transporter ATP-binding protein [Granulosicoccus antarcticus]|uniref:Spermidine/putrescine import ATP-binding protein PotA n=1 Tax=Granulosicoccus antarcticus IMCC3135 TaxID=1192854 RepID=A0A2Z2NL57_9GAMM|nr:ABC transporter ATP-binding protein [Granulosicoccus antarcticus]ASJ71879.1 Spermidine/putrescine import ATP-binding protein PotA [Granulosicoccus antarcticus IMCC3135]
MNNPSEHEASDTAAIEVRNVRKVFDSGGKQVTALNDVNVAIRRNEFFTLLGPSGCGKTTLLRLIAGFEFPTAGSIRLNGKDIATLPPYRRPVNTVFQSYALFPHMSVAQNIGFGLKMLGKPKAEIAHRIDEVLRLVRMEDLRDRATSEISGGQQQRVALARALAPSPEVLLLDEPLSALDYKLRKQMQIELKRMQSDTGITFIFVTHDQEEALTMSDRIAVMSAGRILQVGSPHDIYERPVDRFVAGFIGESNFLQGHILTTREGLTQVSLDVGEVSAATLWASCNELPADADQADNKAVTVVVRPEHASLTDDIDRATLTGKLENIVYSGTDTHYHVSLPNRQSFIIRSQNRRGGTADHEQGQLVGISIDEAAAQLVTQ